MSWRPLKKPNAEVDPERIRASVDKVAKKLGAPTAVALSGLFQRWDEIVGPGISAHARPVSLTRGCLLVEVDSTAWATQLRYMTSDLVVRCCEELGDGAVRQMEIRVKR